MRRMGDGWSMGDGWTISRREVSLEVSVLMGEVSLKT